MSTHVDDRYCHDDLFEKLMKPILIFFLLNAFWQNTVSYKFYTQNTQKPNSIRRPFSSFLIWSFSGGRGNDGSGGISGPTTPNDAGAATTGKKDRSRKRATCNPKRKERDEEEVTGGRFGRAKAAATTTETRNPTPVTTSSRTLCGQRRQRHVSRLCYTSRVSS